MSGWRCVGSFAYYVLLSAFCSSLRRSLRHGAILDLARLDISESPCPFSAVLAEPEECALKRYGALLLAKSLPPLSARRAAVMLSEVRS